MTLVLVWSTWDPFFAAFPAIVGDCFGTCPAPANDAVLYTPKGVASIISGWLGAVLFAQSRRRTVAFQESSVMAAIAAAPALGLRAAASRRRSAVGPAASR